MPRSTKENSTGQKAQLKQSPKTKTKTTSLAKRIWSVGAILIGIPGVLTALLALLPRMTPTVSDPVDPKDPFSSSVTITNTGLVPIFRATPFVRVVSVVTTENKELRGSSEGQGTLISESDWPHERTIGLDDRISFSLNEVIDLPADQLYSADLAVVLQYQVPLIHWHRYKQFPIHTRKQTNGQFYWYASY